MTIKKMPVNEKELSKKEAEYYATVGEQQQKGMYYYIDQMKHNGMCYVKGINHPVKLVPRVQTYVVKNEVIKEWDETYNRLMRARMVKVLPVINE